jgi:hypothetical protein
MARTRPRHPAVRRPNALNMLHVRTSPAPIGGGGGTKTSRDRSSSTLESKSDNGQTAEDASLSVSPGWDSSTERRVWFRRRAPRAPRFAAFCDRAFDVHGFELVVDRDFLDRRLPGHFHRIAAACGALRRRSGETAPRRRGRAVRGRQSSDSECLITNGPTAGTGPRGPCSALSLRIRQPAFVRVFVEHAR